MVQVAERTEWTRKGVVLARRPSGNGAHVVGDPCIVWDPDISAWRMILFFDPPGHGTAVAESVDGLPENWSEPEPLVFTNPEVYKDGWSTHKPWIVLDPTTPNRAAKINGRYCLITVDTHPTASSSGDGGKHVRRGWADTLAGPWTMEEEAIIPLGGPGEIDELHVDVVSGYWFEDRQEFVYYYMANTRAPRADLPGNPFGGSIAYATQKLDDPIAVKHGVLIDPPAVEGHWASGYLGGLQILPGTAHRWVGIINASPTHPSHDGSLTSEEPPPCLAGFAYSDSEYPTSGWVLEHDPVEWIADLPEEAVAAGENTNFWRQFLVIAGNTARLYYNSGSYGQEQMFLKETTAEAIGVVPSHPNA